MTVKTMLAIGLVPYGNGNMYLERPGKDDVVSNLLEEDIDS